MANGYQFWRRVYWLMVIVFVLIPLNAWRGCDAKGHPRNSLELIASKVFSAFWPPKSTIERISAGICFSQAECDALNRANALNLPEPKFPVRDLSESMVMFECQGIGAH